MDVLVLLLLSLVLSAALAWLFRFRRRHGALPSDSAAQLDCPRSITTPVRSGAAFPGLTHPHAGSLCPDKDQVSPEGDSEAQARHGHKGHETTKLISSLGIGKGHEDGHVSNGGALRIQPETTDPVRMHADVSSERAARRPNERNARSAYGGSTPGASTLADPTDADKHSAGLRQKQETAKCGQADTKDSCSCSRESSFSPPASCSPSSPPSILADDDIPDLTKAEQDFLEEQQRRTRGRFKHQGVSSSSPPHVPLSVLAPCSVDSTAVVSPELLADSKASVLSDVLFSRSGENAAETPQHTGQPGESALEENCQVLHEYETGNHTGGKVKELTPDPESSQASVKMTASPAERALLQTDSHSKAGQGECQEASVKTDCTGAPPAPRVSVGDHIKTLSKSCGIASCLAIPPDPDSPGRGQPSIQTNRGGSPVCKRDSELGDTVATELESQEGTRQRAVRVPVHMPEHQVGEWDKHDKAFDADSIQEPDTRTSATGGLLGGVLGKSEGDNRKEERESSTAKGESGNKDICTVGTSAEIDFDESAEDGAGVTSVADADQRQDSVDKEDEGNVNKEEDEGEDSVPRVEDLGEVLPAEMTEHVDRQENVPSDAVRTPGQKKVQDEDAEDEEDLEDKSAAELKERGNKAFREGNYETALDLYTRALDVLDDEEDDWLDEYDAAMQDKEDELENAERIRYERATKADGGKKDRASHLWPIDGDEGAPGEEMRDAVEEREEGRLYRGDKNFDGGKGPKEVKGEGRQQEEVDKLLTEDEFLAFKEAKEKEREEKAKEFNEIRAILLSNRAACHLHTKCWEAVIADCTEAVQCNPNYPKAYLRRFTANEAVAKWHDAAADISKALELDPSLEPRYRAEQQRVKKKSEEQFEKEKEEMMGKLKDFGNFVLGKIGLSLDNFKVEQNPDTGAYNISFQQNAPSASAGAQ
ncbi:tetratricopeptide repeat-containing protein [Cystoisospora suis]|uniref:Tetratricopeptide repeat-containing protein n=1 Tax=Cystoisospora suis TaxID=483139 RepID=A0A2C6L2X6_9APIC|nr:tetratricopeptide repeat-containing protein [Cystoisospora suis]